MAKKWNYNSEILEKEWKERHLPAANMHKCLRKFLLGFIQFWWLTKNDEIRQSTWSKGTLTRAIEFGQAFKMNKDKKVKKWIMQFHDKTQGNKQVMNWKKRINEFDLKSLKRQGVWIEEGVLTWSRTLSRESLSQCGVWSEV